MTRDNSQGYLVTRHDNICILCNVSPHSSRVNPLTTLGGARNSSGTTKSWNIIKSILSRWAKWLSFVFLILTNFKKCQTILDNTWQYLTVKLKLEGGGPWQREQKHDSELVQWWGQCWRHWSWWWHCTAWLTLPTQDQWVDTQCSDTDQITSSFAGGTNPPILQHWSAKYRNIKD